MSCKNILQLKDGIGNILMKGEEGKYWRNRTRSHIVPDQVLTFEHIVEGKWANLQPELLFDIIRRVEASESSWPNRQAVIFCALVCRSWRETTKEIVKTPEECGKLTFPVSLKQPGPRDFPIQCFVKRDTPFSYFLYIGLSPAEDVRDKFLLAARKIRRTTGTDFVISFNPNDFSKASNAYVGKLRSNLFGTKFMIYDSEIPCRAPVQRKCSSDRRFHFKQVSPRFPACDYVVGSVRYELNVLRTRGPRRMRCVMNSIPISSIQLGGAVSTPTPLHDPFDGSYDKKSSLSVEPLCLKNKPPRWHEQLQCWCLNFKGRVSVASVKNFQLVADVDALENVSEGEQEKVVLQFGKIGKDIFTMDYQYPLSAFQAFAICLSSFDTKPACE